MNNKLFSTTLLWCFIILFISMASCKPENKIFPYYYAEDFALFKLNIDSSSISGSIFWINGKDSTQLKGTIQDNIFIFGSFRNDVEQRYFSYTGYVQNNQIAVVRKANYGDQQDTIIFTAISQAKYDSIVYAALAPPKLETFRRDTIIDNYKFEFLVEDWNPETYKGNATFTIKEKESNKVIQTIISQNFSVNEDLDFEYYDINFDNIKDLIFYNGNNGGYGTMTFDYYLYNTKSKEFLLNEQLAEIAGCMGIEIDTIKNRIISFAKSGCCWHEQKAFVVKDDKFIEVKSLIIDDEYDGSHVTIKNKINGKWKTKKIFFKELTEQQADSLYQHF